MTLETVIHAHDPAESPFYSRLLDFQFQSLLRYRCSFHLKLWVFTTPQDQAVIDVFDKYVDLQTIRGTTHTAALMLQDRQSLFRREIGRNLVCKELLSTTKVVWWCDVDMLPCENCLNTLCQMAHDGSLPPLSYPRKILHNKTHADGMRLLESGILNMAHHDFEEREGVPLGGLMFASGDIARQGFLEHEAGGKFQKPVSGDTFAFSGDVRYRKYWKSRGVHFVPVDVPGIRRLRHFYGHLKKEKKNANCAG